MIRNSYVRLVYEHLFHPVAARDGVDVVCEIDPDPPNIASDASRQEAPR